MDTTTEIGTVEKSASGGTTILIGRRGDGWVNSAPAADLAVLQNYRDDPASAGPLNPWAGKGPFFQPGEVLSWHYRAGTDVAYVVRDDEHGLVCWVPGGGPRISWLPDNVRSIRDIALEQRFAMPYELVRSAWNGPGILRIVPAGKPWSVWYFFADDGTLVGHYVNLELPHLRAAKLDELSTATTEIPARLVRTHTRDLILDLWLDGDDFWIKDQDELAAAAKIGRLTHEQAEHITRLGCVSHMFGEVRGMLVG